MSDEVLVVDEVTVIVTEGMQGPKGNTGDAGASYTNGYGLQITGTVIAVDPAVIPSQDQVASADATTLANANAHADTAASNALTTALAATSTVQGLADSNAFKITQLQDGLDTTNQTVSDNFTSLSASKADQSAFTALQALVDTKATPADVTAAIAALVDGAPAALNTLNEIATALQGDEATIGTILAALDNQVRFDAVQSLTSTQQDQARANINAEKVGVAAGLVAEVTPATIGAATSAQGAKADSAIQSGDLAPVALSGSFSDLVNLSSLFNLVYSAYVIGSNAVISASDTLGQMLGKLQAQVSAKLDATANAVSATKLNTARNINGVPFDGTANITIAATSLRKTTAISSSSGVVTIDLASGNEVFYLSLTENVTSWTFNNLPASGYDNEICVIITQSSSTAYTVANPASGKVAGGFSPNSSALNAVETWAMRFNNAGIHTLYQSGVNA